MMPASDARGSLRHLQQKVLTELCEDRTDLPATCQLLHTLPLGKISAQTTGLRVALVQDLLQPILDSGNEESTAGDHAATNDLKSASGLACADVVSDGYRAALDFARLERTESRAEVAENLARQLVAGQPWPRTNDATLWFPTAASVAAAVVKVCEVAAAHGELSDISECHVSALVDAILRDGQHPVVKGLRWATKGFVQAIGGPADPNTTTMIKRTTRVASDIMQALGDDDDDASRSRHAVAATLGMLDLQCGDMGEDRKLIEDAMLAAANRDSLALLALHQKLRATPETSPSTNTSSGSDGLGILGALVSGDESRLRDQEAALEHEPWNEGFALVVGPRIALGVTMIPDQRLLGPAAFTVGLAYRYKWFYAEAAPFDAGQYGVVDAQLGKAIGERTQIREPSPLDVLSPSATFGAFVWEAGNLVIGATIGISRLAVGERKAYGGLQFGFAIPVAQLKQVD